MDADPPGEATAWSDGPSGVVAGSLRVDRVLDTDTPVFLVAAEEGTPHALSVLAAKDADGNARAITGVAFIEGEDYLSVEYDPFGRPARLASPAAVVRLFDYDAVSVMAETTFSNGETTNERVSLTPEELESLRVVLPSAVDLSVPASSLTLDKAGGSVLEGLISGAINAFGCLHAVDHATDPRPTTGWRSRIVFGVLGVLECPGLAVRLETVRRFVEDNHREIEAAAYVAGCVGSLASAATLPVHPILGALGAASAYYECPEAAKKVYRLINDRMYAARVAQGFRLLVADGELVTGMDSLVTLELRTEANATSAADGGLGGVVANLGAVGGEANVEFTLQDGAWRWRGTLHPRTPGQRLVLVSIGSRPETVGLGLYVMPDRNSVTAQVFASTAVVRYHESVEVFVQAEGGELPYRHFWTEQRAGASAKPMPDKRDVGRFTVELTEATRYAASVSDAKWRYADAGSVSIEVCGDGQCAPAEVAFGCVEDCGSRDAKLCQEACTYRQEVLACAGFPGACQAVCLAVFIGVNHNHPCAPFDLEYQRCTYSRPALDLGCTTLDGGNVCKPLRDAAQQCRSGN